MQKAEKILVVVDPNDDVQVALQRALVTSQQREVKPQLRVFVGVDHEAVDTSVQNERLCRDLHWFQQTIKGPLLGVGMPCDVEMSWSSAWPWAIRDAANTFGAEAIYLPLHHRTKQQRLTITESKWDLLKTVECSVLLVRPGSVQPRKVVLATVNFQAQGVDRRVLNEKIIARGRLVAKRNGATFHVVNAYLDSMASPDCERLAHELQLSVGCVHVQQGYTDEVVAEVAHRIGADVVIVGTLARADKARLPRGNTAERVINGVGVDVMVLNHKVSR